MVLPKQRLFFSAAISKQTIKTISSYPLLYLVNDKKRKKMPPSSLPLLYLTSKACYDRKKILNCMYAVCLFFVYMKQNRKCCLVPAQKWKKKKQKSHIFMAHHFSFTLPLLLLLLLLILFRICLIQKLITVGKRFPSSYWPNEIYKKKYTFCT